MGAKHQNNKITILILIILLIPYLGITGIRNAMSATAYQSWQLASAMGMFLLAVTVASQIRLNGVVGIFTLYQLVIFFSSTVHQGFSPGIMTVSFAAVLIFMLLQTDYYQGIISAISAIVVLSVMINLPVMIPRINEKNALFFIGGKNALSMFLVPGALFLMVRSLETTSKISKMTFFTIALCLVSVFIGSSGTGMVVAVLAVGLMILAIKFKPRKKVYILVILIFYALFLIFSEFFFGTDSWVAFTNFLGKDSTLTSRTTIWGLVKNIILDNWLFGSGRGTVISYVNTWGDTIVMYEAHNFILEILMEGGVVAFALYSALFAKAVKHLDMNDIKNKIIFVALCVVLINGLTESTLNNFFVTMVLGVACRYAEENRGRNNLNEQPI